MKRNYSEYLGRIGLLLFSALTVVFVSEIALRIADYDPLQRLRIGRELLLRPSTNGDVRYQLTPGAKVPAWDIEINAHGHRGRMGTFGKFAGFRILVAGDSITFGNHLPVEATYAHQLHHLLNESGTPYEVLNLAVGGYDVLQEVAQLEDIAPIYEPDMLVVGFCLNDVGIASLNLEYIERVSEYRSGTRFRLRALQYVVSRIERLRLGSWLAEKNRPEVFASDYANRIVHIGADEYRLRELLERAPDRYPSHWYRSEERIGRLRHAFARLSELAARESSTVVVVVIPWLEGKQDDYRHGVAHQMVAMEAQRVGFDVVDLLPDFTAVGMESLRISEGDLVHPNRRGHTIAAEKLAEYIRDVLLDRPSNAPQ